jgi:chromosome segregation ATPase
LSPQIGRAKEKGLLSIQSAMLLALGFLAASLFGLLLASAFWSRAVRLTTARIKQSLPVSEQEIQADRDRLRAEYAIKVHKLETHLEQAKLARARQLVELNRRDASISTLETNIAALKAELEEHQNARRVLEQTVADRLPKVEARLAEAKRLILSREREIAELLENAKRHKLALEEAASINAQQTAQIERLTSAVAQRGGRGKPAGDSAGEAETALRSELDALRAKARDQANVIDRLQRNASGAQGLGPQGKGGREGAARPTQDVLAQAESALASARAGASGSDPSATLERELRALKAKAEDQAGEIARLKAALASFEAEDKAEGSKESRSALRARLGSAQAHAEHQSAMIGRLRAELAAVNERLARQAAHFMEEMRRLGAGSMPATQPRTSSPRADRRPLAERVAHVRSTAAEPASPAKAAEPQAPGTADNAQAGGRNGLGSERDSASPAAAAQMPKASDIPVEGRRPRLLDRITSLTKE